jgi:phosphopantetheinyl transferase
MLLSALRVVRLTPQALLSAEESLLPGERLEYEGFRFEKRQQEWLMGRWLLKVVAAEALSGAWRPEQIAISKTAAGAPQLLVPDAAVTGLCLALSHSHGWAGAAATPWAVGIDLERVRAMPSGAWRFFLSETERDWLAGEPWGPHSEVIAWSLKEAAFKALGGVSRSLRPIELRCTRAQACEAWYGETRLLLRWAVRHDMCVALATAPEGAAWLNEIEMQALMPVALNAK